MTRKRNYILAKPVPIKQRWLYIMSPFLLLILCLSSLNLIRWFRSRPIEVVTATAVATSTPTPHPVSLPLLATATPNPSIPIPTPAYTPPSYNDSQNIQLLGPPTGSTFAPESTISFYWQWPLPLSKDQFFEVYLLAEGEEMLLGTVTEPNLGDSYRLHVVMEEVGITAVSLQWQVRLTSNLSSQSLRTSPERPLTLLYSRRA